MNKNFVRRETTICLHTVLGVAATSRQLVGCPAVVCPASTPTPHRRGTVRFIDAQTRARTPDPRASERIFSVNICFYTNEVLCFSPPLAISTSDIRRRGRLESLEKHICRGDTPDTPSNLRPPSSYIVALTVWEPLLQHSFAGPEGAWLPCRTVGRSTCTYRYLVENPLALNVLCYEGSCQRCYLGSCGVHCLGGGGGLLGPGTLGQQKCGPISSRDREGIGTSCWVLLRCLSAASVFMTG